jgi:hypothetical protein
VRIHPVAVICLLVTGSACEGKPSKAALSPGQIACVLDKTDGHRIGTFVAARPAADSGSRIVTVAVDSGMKQLRDVAVPAEGTVGPCPEPTP